MMPELVVLCGPPASGKSTYVQSHYPAHDIVAMDALFARSERPHGQFWTDLRHVLGHGANVVIDRTCLHADTRLTALTLARRYDYTARLVFFDVPLWQLIQRDSDRMQPHDPEILVRVWRKAQDAKRSILTEGWDEVEFILP